MIKRKYNQPLYFSAVCCMARQVLKMSMQFLEGSSFTHLSCLNFGLRNNFKQRCQLVNFLAKSGNFLAGFFLYKAYSTLSIVITVLNEECYTEFQSSKRWPDPQCSSHWCVWSEQITSTHTHKTATDLRQLFRVGCKSKLCFFSY